MKKLLLMLVWFVVVAAVLGGLVFAYRQMRSERDQEASAEAPVVAPSRLGRDADGTPWLKLDAETCQRLGLRTAQAVAGSVSPQLTGTARVLEGGALVGQLHEIQAAQLVLAPARLEYERKQKLFDNGQNTAAAAVEAAAALVKQNQASLDAARDRLTAAWGTNLTGRPDLEGLARSLLTREAALVRIELLATAKLAVPPATVRLFRQNGEELATARVLGPALNADSAVIGPAFLALVASNAAALVPGASLVARLEAGAPETGVVLPREAVVRHTGQGWVYVETSPATFARRPVPLDHPHPAGWLVPGQWPRPILISGAQSLLSEELKGSIRLRD